MKGWKTSKNEEKLLMTQMKIEKKKALAKDKGLCKTLKTKLWFKSHRTLLISSGEFTGCIKDMKSTGASIAKKNQQKKPIN